MSLFPNFCPVNIPSACLLERTCPPPFCVCLPFYSCLCGRLCSSVWILWERALSPPHSSTYSFILHPTGEFSSTPPTIQSPNPLTWTPTCYQRSLANIHPLHFTPMCSIPWQYDQPPLLPITTSSPIYPSNITPPTPSPSPPHNSFPPPPFKSLCIRPTLQCHRLIQIGRLRFPLIANANFCFQQINRCVFLISLRLSNRFVRFLLFLF